MDITKTTVEELTKKIALQKQQRQVYWSQYFPTAITKIVGRN